MPGAPDPGARAIYSQRDGVVAWQACIDRQTRGVGHVEVAATHLGLGFSPEVFQIIAERLGDEPAPRPRGNA